MRISITLASGSAPMPARCESLAVLKMTEADDIGGFSRTGKMPWLSWSTPASRCQTGSRLHGVPGSVCEHCYARGGGYRYCNVQEAQERRFALLDDLVAFADAVTARLRDRAARFMPSQESPVPAFRWHDSGDLQSADHLLAICDVAEGTQDVTLTDGSTADVLHWLPTREYGYVVSARRKRRRWPRNLTVRLSAHMVDGPAPTKYRLPVSTVHTDPAVYEDAHVCPAPRQGNRCSSCRACWDATVPHVSYAAH